MHCQAKPCQVGLSHWCHVYDISLSIFFRCLHDFFMIVVLLSYIGLSLRHTTN